MNIDARGFALFVTGLELDVPFDPVASDDEIVAGAVDLGPEQFDLSNSLGPQQSHHLAHEQVLNDAGTQARLQRVA